MGPGRGRSTWKHDAKRRIGHHAEAAAGQEATDSAPGEAQHEHPTAHIEQLAAGHVVFARQTVHRPDKG